MKIGRLNKDQKGLTLIELVIAIALTGLITTAITTTVFQVFNMNARSANRMTAVSQVQHAGEIVPTDILQAKNVTPGETLGFPLTLTWEHWVTNATHDDIQVIYNLVDMPSGGLKRLERRETITPPGGSPTVSIVAEYIDPTQTSFVWAGGTLTFRVTATVGDESETQVYEVQPRPGS